MGISPEARVHGAAKVSDSDIESGAEIHAAYVVDSRVEHGATVQENAIVRGSWIGSGVTIGRNCTIVNCRVDDGTVIFEGCDLMDCTVEKGVVIRANCMLVETHVGEGCRVDQNVRVNTATMSREPRNMGRRGQRLGKPSIFIETITSESLALYEKWTHLEKSSAGRDVVEPVPSHVHSGAVLGHEVVIAGSVVGPDCVVEPFAQVLLSSLGSGSRVRLGAGLQSCRIGNRAHIEPEAVLNEVRGGDDLKIARRVLAGRLGESGVHLGDHTSLGIDADIDLGARLGRRFACGKSVVIGSYVDVADNVTLGQRVTIETGASLGGDITIDNFAALGASVRVGSGVRIGSNSIIERDAVIESGLSLGDDTTIPAASVVDRDMAGGEAWGVSAPGTAAPESVIAINANAEAWVYSRLADVAGDRKLTREAVKRERPELLEHPLTKQLLRMQPSPTGPELIALSEGAKDATKYIVNIVPKAWTGAQRMGTAHNDVMRFQLSGELLDELVGFAPEALHEGLGEQVLAYLRQHTIHQTADERTLGWVRFFLLPDEGLVVVEEFQSDLPLLREVMGVTMAEIDLDDVEIPQSHTWTELNYAQARPYLEEAAAHLGLSYPPPPSATELRVRDAVYRLRPPGVRQRLGHTIIIHRTSVLPWFITHWNSFKGKHVILPYDDDEPCGSWIVWGEYLRELATAYGSSWQLTPQLFTAEVLDALEAQEDSGPGAWTAERLVTLDMHIQLMALAEALFEKGTEAQRQVWRNFIVHLHDLYETMMAFVLDWAAGRTRTVAGETAGPGFEVKHVVIPTYEMKKKVRYAGRPPTYPYSKLYRQFQSAPKVPVPAEVDLSSTGSGESATVRLLRPNDPSIWDEAY